VGGDSPADYAHAFARLENHYFTHRGFLDHDGQILDRMGEIAHIPGTIVQGRYDMICPPATAHRLAEAWPGSDLRLIPLAGHALSEPGISADLVSVMRKLGTRY
jgi:proline iminopeptidase